MTPNLHKNGVFRASEDSLLRGVIDVDELIVHSCNFDDCLFGKQSQFDFGRHRRIEHYGLITRQTGVVKPLECD